MKEVTYEPSRQRRPAVAFRRVRRERAGESRVLTVFCPRKLAVIELGECRICEHCRGLCVDPTDRDTWLRCAGSPADGGEGGPAAGVAGGHRGHDPGDRLSTIMTAPVRCVAPETNLVDLTETFLETGISAAPVIDSDGNAVGVVSKTDVLRQCYSGSEDTNAVAVASDAARAALELLSSDRLRSLVVRDVMTHVVFCLPEEASISRAAALMSYEGVHRVVVTSAGNQAVGIVSSLDILRWIARRDGYVLPDRGGASEQPK